MMYRDDVRRLVGEELNKHLAALEDDRELTSTLLCSRPTMGPSAART